MTRPSPSEAFLRWIEEAQFNSFDGQQIAADLRANGDLWQAVMFCRPRDWGVTLRDMPDGVYSADTIYLLTDVDRWQSLWSIVWQWSADSILVMLPRESFRLDVKSEGGGRRYMLEPIRSPAPQDDLPKFLGVGPRVDLAVFQLWWD